MTKHLLDKINVHVCIWSMLKAETHLTLKANIMLKLLHGSRYYTQRYIPICPTSSKLEEISYFKLAMDHIHVQLFGN